MIIFIAKAGWSIPRGIGNAIHWGLYDYIIIFVTFGETTFGEPTFGEPTFGETTFGELTFGEPTFGETPVNRAMSNNWCNG